MIGPTRNRIISAALGGAGIAMFSLAAQPAMADGSMEVRDFVLSHGVSQREPVDETQSFRIEDGKAFAFARIRNTGAPQTVSFVWHYGETVHATVPMNIGTSPGWRAWSTARLRPGSWRVELVDAAGEVLGTKAFSVGPTSAAGPVAMQEDAMPGNSNMGGRGNGR